MSPEIHRAFGRETKVSSCQNERLSECGAQVIRVCVHVRGREGIVGQICFIRDAGHEFNEGGKEWQKKDDDEEGAE